MENNATISTGFAGGNNVVDGVLTTTIANEAVPGLLRNETDTRIARVRPMATPVDSISRMIGARKSSSMIVDYYSVDSKQPSIKADDNLVDTGVKHSSGKVIYTLDTKENGFFAQSDTILVSEIMGAIMPGAKNAVQLILYVIESVPQSGVIKVIGINSDSDGEVNTNIKGKALVRMGRAAAELDVQTSQFEALPTKATNYCQIFKAQIEQSHMMRQSAKEVGWTFSDQEEVAVMDMRMTMEMSFVFGVKSRIAMPGRGDEVMFTEGIWNQAGTDVTYQTNSFGHKNMTEIMKAAFSGTASGSCRKILFAGSDFIANINNLEVVRVMGAKDRTTRWGVDFSEVVSKFGSLMVVHAEVFDLCGHSADGLIVDPQYLTKYVHEPFKVDTLDMKSCGSRNTEAVVLTEASCLVLRNPKAHVRVTGSK